MSSFLLGVLGTLVQALLVLDFSSIWTANRNQKDFLEFRKWISYTENTFDHEIAGHYIDIENPSYKTQLRLNIWLANRRYIERHNSKNKSSYQLGFNAHSFRTHLEFCDIYFRPRHQAPSGVTIPKRIPMDKLDKFRAKSRANRPAQELIKAEGPVQANRWLKRLSTVIDQNECASSYIIAVVHLLKAKFLRQFYFSVQYLLDCGTEMGYLNGCEDSFPELTMMFIEKYGLYSQSDYGMAYSANEMYCKLDLNNQNNVSKVSMDHLDFYHELDPNTIAGSEQLKQFIDHLGPFIVAMDGTAFDMQHYKSGLFHATDCSDSKANHYVLLMGYGRDPVTQQEFLEFRSSIGEHWGEQGHFRIGINDRICAIYSKPWLYVTSKL